MKSVHILKAHYKEALILILIAVLYFAFRLPALTYQPIFADEAIYIRWAQVMKAEPTLRFLPLTDGKTPLFMWLMMPVLKFVPDPLFAGRILAVFSGLTTLAGVYLIGRFFFNARVALFSAFLVAVTPYIFFFDRMALVDTLLAGFVVWSIFFGLLVVKYKRLDLAMFLGFFLGGGLLTKTPGMFNVVMIPLTALTMNFSPKGRVGRVLKTAGLFVVSIVIGLGIYNLLRLGPGFGSLNSRNSDYVRNPLDIFKNPADPFLPHLRDLTDFWPSLIGYPVLLALAAGIIFMLIKRNRFAIAIFLIGLGPLLIQMFLLQTFTARYMLFSIAPFLIVASFGLDNLLNLAKKSHGLLISGVVLALIIWPAYFNYMLVTDIENAPLPKNERRGYLEDWTAGYGLREIAQTLEVESQKGQVVIGTEGSFGTLPDGIQIYFDKNTSVAFKPDKAGLSDDLKSEASRSATYYISNRSRFSEKSEGVEVLKIYEKAIPANSEFERDATILFKVLPVRQ